MIPRKLAISGFLSYKDPVEIDFQAIHVACITGQNGAGKSAMLDAITWALFGEARRNDDSVVNNSPDINQAEVTFEFEYEATVYRVLRRRPLGKTTVLEVSLWEPIKEEWRPITEKTVTQTNKLIETLLHLDYKTFINASFFLQGKADQFTNQNASERKKILSNILDLDVWEKYQQIAVERRKKQMQHGELLSQKLTEIDRELEEEEPRKTLLAELTEQLKAAEAEQAARQLTWQAAQQAEEALRSLKNTLEVQRKAVSSLEQRLQSDQRRLNERTADQARLQNELRDEESVETAYRQLQEVRLALVDWNQKAADFYAADNQLKSLKAAIEKKSIRLETDQKNAKEELDRIDVPAEALEKLLTIRLQYAERLKELEQSLSEKSALEAEQNRIASEESEKRAENLRLKDQMQELKGKITQLENAESGTPCPFCGQALDAAHSQSYLESLRAEGTRLGDRYRTNIAELKALDEQKQARALKAKQLAEFEHEKTNLVIQSAKNEGEIQTLERNQNRVQELNDRLAQLAKQLASDQFCAEEKTQIAALQTQLAEIQYDKAAHDAATQQEGALAGSEKRWQELIAAKAALEPLQKEISSLSAQVETQQKELADAEIALSAQQQQVDAKVADLPDVLTAKAQFDAAQHESVAIRDQKVIAEQKVSVLAELKKNKKALSVERDTVNQQISQLRVLEKAFSKNGIPAILIDQALPEIEEQANLILGRLTDERMSVCFSTQRAYKDKSKEEKRETLDINISDESGTRAYEMFSGGEAFRVNFAIRLALSNLLAKRSGARLQMLVIDEGFGSQDSEGRQRLIEAITAVQDDYEKILVITHLEDMKDAFPSRIEVEKTEEGSAVKVIA